MEETATINISEIAEKVHMHEARLQNIEEDIRDIKKYLKWILGLLLSSHSTIIGMLAKGFNLI